MQKVIETEEKTKMLSSQPNTSDTPFDQSSPVHQEVGVLDCHRQTHRQTDGHGDSITDPAQRAESVKIVL